jgi:hypothetical protein
MDFFRTMNAAIWLHASDTRVPLSEYARMSTIELYKCPKRDPTTTSVPISIQQHDFFVQMVISLRCIPDTIQGNVSIHHYPLSLSLCP